MCNEAIDYDFSHLQPHYVVYTIPASKEKNKPETVCRVRVSYSDHCYTVKDMTDVESNKRIFNEERYKLSLRLPNIIANLMQYKCSFASRKSKNYYVVHRTVNNEDYEVYFEVFKQPGTKSLGIFVHSAYVRSKERLQERPKWTPIKFSIILLNTLSDKKIKRPDNINKRYDQ